MTKRIYLDSAAATPVDARVLRAMEPYFTDVFYNPSALYEGARGAKKALEDARQSVAQTIGARPSEIVFTAGGTESANLAIHGVMQAHLGAELLVSAIEHDAVMKPSSMYSHKVVAVDGAGRVSPDTVRRQITDKTVLVSVMLANNEVGTMQQIRELAAVVAAVQLDRKKTGSDLPLYLHTDACQAPLYADIHVARLGVDLMTLNGGKMHGPKQSGILYVRAGVVISPQITGGGQEFGYRSGTENVAFAVGFAKALELAEKGKAARVKQVTGLREHFMRQLEEKCGAEVNGHRKHRLAHNVHVTFSGGDNERMLFALDDLGVDAAAGSACSASNDTSSHVLLAMGRTAEVARSSLRFSLSQSTTEVEIDTAIEAIKKALKA